MSAQWRIGIKEKERLKKNYMRVIKRRSTEHLNKFPIDTKAYEDFYWGLLPPTYKKIVDVLNKDLSHGGTFFTKMSRYLIVKTHFISKDAGQPTISAKFHICSTQLIPDCPKPLEVPYEHPKYNELATWLDQLYTMKHEEIRARTTIERVFNSLNTIGQLYRVMPEVVRENYPHGLELAEQAQVKSRLPRMFYEDVGLKDEINHMVSLYTYCMLLGDTEDIRKVTMPTFKIIDADGQSL
jgi:hypothetical protein